MPDQPSTRDDSSEKALLGRITDLVAPTEAEAATLTRAFGALVPAWADWALVASVSDDGSVRIVEQANTTGDGHSKIDAIVAAATQVLPDAVHTELALGHAVLLDDYLEAAAPKLAGQPGLRSAYEELSPHSTIVVPLAVLGGRPALLVAAMTTSGRAYSEDDRRFAERLGHELQPIIESSLLRAARNEARSVRDSSAVLLDAVFDSSPLGLAFFDSDLRIKRVNETFLSIVGGSPELVTLREDSDLGRQMIPAVRSVIAGADKLVELEITVSNDAVPSGANHYLAHVYGVSEQDGTLAGAGIALLDVTARVEAEAARALSDSQLRIALDAARMGIFRCDAHNELVQWSATTAVLLGIDPLAKPSLHTLLSAVHPHEREAVEASMTTCVADRDNCEVQFRLAGRPDDDERWLLLKAQVGDDPGSTELIGVIVDITEQRARTDEQARLARLQAQAGEQAVRMQRVSAALTRALTVTQVCDVLVTEGSAALGAPRSTVYLLDEQSETMEFVRAHGSTFSDNDNGAHFQAIPVDGDLPINDVLRTGEPIVLSGFESIAERYPHAVDIARQLNTERIAAVRLHVAGQIFGVWTLSWMDAREFDDGELIVLLSLAVQGGQAMERARMFERERFISTALQRTLLPAELPDLKAATVARRYVPGSADIEVGGDWYDVISLSPSRVALVIGDVSGHNVDSAAVMGQVRNAVRSYAWEGHQAGRVIEATNKMLCGLEPGVLITCCFVELNLDDGIASIALAGHPPPLIKRDNGETEMMELTADPPLGTDVNAAYSQATMFLAPGDAMVMYTDGLVETRDTPLGTGLAYLTRATNAVQETHPEEIADYLLSNLHVAEREDDVAILILRYEPTSASARSHKVVRRHLVSTPASAGVARRFAGDVLSDWGVEDLSDQVSLCVSELVTNALIHTPTDVELVLKLTSDNVRVEIVDKSDRMPIIRSTSKTSDTTGRGLQIVQALADDWGIDATSEGKSVWFQIRR